MRISDWSSDVCSSDLTIERDVHEMEVVPVGVLHVVPHDRELLATHLEDLVAKPVLVVRPESLNIHEVLAHEIPDLPAHLGRIGIEIGRASCRERVCQYV